MLSLIGGCKLESGKIGKRIQEARKARGLTQAELSQLVDITPKYLSAVCKEASGQTASELINQYVVKDIVYLLHQPDKSIKDIAFELDFPNLSFFGKYVKKHLGMSPKMYRKENKL